MKYIDLNADLGEAEDKGGIAAELSILSVISSANIACGGHAGDAVSMTRMVEGAIAESVRIGAHPAYPDRVNFGRKSMTLGEDIAPADLEISLKRQITTLRDIAIAQGTDIAYVKPHGALYNDAVKSPALAKLIADVIKAISPELSYMGAPHSAMGIAAQEAGLSFISEGFIDRRYTDDGHLQNRAIPGAVLDDQAERLAQAKSLATTGAVTTDSGKSLRLNVQSLCLHGDSPGALETARLARSAIEAEGLIISADHT